MQDFSGPKWRFKEFKLVDAPNKMHVLTYRDLRECGDHLMGTPNFAGHLRNKPIVRTGLDGKTQILTEMCDGNDWNNLQVSELSLCLVKALLT